MTPGLPSTREITDPLSFDDLQATRLRRPIPSRLKLAARQRTFVELVSPLAFWRSVIEGRNDRVPQQRSERLPDRLQLIVSDLSGLLIPIDVTRQLNWSLIFHEAAELPFRREPESLNDRQLHPT